jgi:hypothetical protein
VLTRFQRARARPQRPPPSPRKGPAKGEDALTKPTFWGSGLQVRGRGRGLHSRARASGGRGGAFPVARVALRSPAPAVRVCGARAVRLSAVRLHSLKSLGTSGRRPRQRSSSTRPRSSFCVRALIFCIPCHTAALVFVSQCGAAFSRSPSSAPPRRSDAASTRACVARLESARWLQILGGSAAFAMRAPPFPLPLLRLLRLRSASTP